MKILKFTILTISLYTLMACNTEKKTNEVNTTKNNNTEITMNGTEITMKGTKLKTVGQLPKVGSTAPDFNLAAKDLSIKKLSDFAGKKVVLNIFPSVDTGTCAMSVKTFNEKAATLENTVVLCISRDLPFAQARFCGAEGIENVVMLSDFATGQFGKDYGLELASGPVTGLHSRCIVIIDANGKIAYTEQVAELSNEPNYEAALAAL